MQMTSTTIIPNSYTEPVHVPLMETNESSEDYIIKLLYVIDRLESDRSAIHQILIKQSN